ncbi:XRE family transcriptional regulator [Bacteriovorax sp. PP10]|uniref:XRE family transcriptional regulator n=1 Tax=Bacteriovorax antarcticus TaxID=3088717 RepID=A0ABU5VU68_9BACT|nr:XRE family transcriptional regulator [Bacteriovorax sp. PP10]MEA9356605.1 XRE family transcriptional regulator [Bacteriovorax sp. PP10]
MTYPSQEQIIQMMLKIEKKKAKGQIRKIKPLSKDASPLLHWKFKISQKIVEFKVIKGLSLEDMSNLLEVDPGNLSRILNGHIEKVTLDKLLSYLEILLIASKNKKASDNFHANAQKFFELEDVKFG